MRSMKQKINQGRDNETTEGHKLRWWNQETN